jgi:hypothetical protein
VRRRASARQRDRLGDRPAHGLQPGRGSDGDGGRRDDLHERGRCGASFENTPLTDISVSVDSQVDGGTSSTITCESEPMVTTDPDGDGSLTITDLEPNVPDGIVCTIVIDP